MSTADAWEKWFWRDWKTDPRVRRLSIVNRGILFELLGDMWLERVASWTGTAEELAGQVTCTVDHAIGFIRAVDKSRALDVDNFAAFDAASDVERACHIEVTLTSRRRARDLKAKEDNRLRQQEHRAKKKGNEGVTPDVTDTSQPDNAVESESETDPSSLRSEGSPERAEAPPGASSAEHGNGSTAPAGASPALDRIGPSDRFLSIPLKSGEPFNVTGADLAEWAEAYPSVDLEQALRDIRQWNRDNPANRKTRRGIRRHINRWLAGEQRRRSVGGEHQEHRDGQSRPGGPDGHGGSAGRPSAVDEAEQGIARYLARQA